MKNESNTHQIQISELEARLKKSETEIEDHFEAMKEKDKKISFLESKCDDLEKYLKVQIKKSKKKDRKQQRKYLMMNHPLKLRLLMMNSKLSLIQ